MPLTTFSINSSLCLQSLTYFNGIPILFIIISKSLKYEAFHRSVKQMMLYHGGTIFGKVCNNPSLLANTVLGILVDCMYGEPTFLQRMLPVAKLNSEFLAEQISETSISIKTSGGTGNSLICDNNQTNHKFFKSFRPPYQCLLMIFDYVHITKGIRNNWLTKKLGELVFEDNNIQKTANWSHLDKLYQLESQSILKL